MRNARFIAGAGSGIGAGTARAALRAGDCIVATAVAFAISQPEEMDVNEILFRPTRQEL
jgi:NAD(P)-dependent dehydrogenase (short-subunit alcohol dehydrogenase family)